ncbi:MAG: redoxin domain-containing protein [Ignavibacteria bacterium]|nr:redoxin domain-containing protein [Ignavibacteria bacterium]
MGKFHIKSGIFVVLILMIAIINQDIYTGGNGLNSGDTCPNSEFLFESIYNQSLSQRNTVNIYDYKENKTMLIAFLPEIGNKNKYSEIITSAFETYFSEGMAFGRPYEWNKYKDNIKVLLVTKNDQAEVKDFLNQKNFSFDIVPDINLELANSFGINSWDSQTEASYVYVVDKNNKITFANHDYKGEGEKLRTIQKELFAQLNITDPAYILKENNQILFTGDNAPDFKFTYTDFSSGTQSTASLSDYFGIKNVIIAFYPAPYSMSCAAEVKTFDAYAENQTLNKLSSSNVGAKNDVEILMVSNSGIEILNKWKKDMQLKNVKLVSDNSGLISSEYASNSSFGYFKRTLFIIDKTGKISYINWNYQVDDKDFGIVQDQLAMIAEN